MILLKISSVAEPPTPILTSSAKTRGVHRIINKPKIKTERVTILVTGI
jgi:hypothetical protein